jgi:hypothetical protein
MWRRWAWPTKTHGGCKCCWRAATPIEYGQRWTERPRPAAQNRLPSLPAIMRPHVSHDTKPRPLSSRSKSNAHNRPTRTPHAPDRDQLTQRFLPIVAEKLPEPRFIPRIFARRRGDGQPLVFRGEDDVTDPFLLHRRTEPRKLKRGVTVEQTAPSGSRSKA